ncbi:MAG: PEGA domain-containing protein [Candidatus Binatia bacterium]|nr:PEGA domain-containing protein [Candidatus Binatia bacterium]
MKPRIEKGLYAVLGFILSGCATLISGPTQRVQIVSDPPGAVAKIGVREVTTPATVELSRKTSYRVTIEKDGYEPAQREISRRTNNQVYWNLLAGGMVLGMLVDLSSGAFYELDPPVIQVSLIPKGEGPQASNR